MTDTNKKISPLAAGIAGGIAGALGTAAAIALSDEKNRKKVTKQVHDVKTWGSKKIDTMKKTKDTLLDEADQALSELEKKVEERTDAKTKSEDLTEQK